MSLLVGIASIRSICGRLLRFILPFGHILLFFEACSTHQSSINMGYVLPPIPDDLFLERILKVIMEGTFDEVIA